MKRQLVILAVLVVVVIVFSFIISQMNKGSLTGELVLDQIVTSGKISLEDKRIFLISASVSPILDSLYIQYDKNVVAFEDTVNRLRRHIKENNEMVIKEEALFKMTYGDRQRKDKSYLKDKADLDNSIAEGMKLEEEYQVKRKTLISLQISFNNAIASLIDRKVMLKTETDAGGNFRFPKVPDGEYYVYVLIVMAGDEDITNEPLETYFKHALATRPIRKYSWMYKLEITDETYLRLDNANMFPVFK